MRKSDLIRIVSLTPARGMLHPFSGRLVRTHAILYLCALLSVVLSGCHWSRIILPQHVNSNDREGQRVTLELLTHEQWQKQLPNVPGPAAVLIELPDVGNGVAPADGGDGREGFKRKIENAFGKVEDINKVFELKPEEAEKAATEGAGAALAAGIAAQAVRLAAGYVRGRIEKEASLYEAQFVGDANGKQFWSIGEHGGKLYFFQTYAGFKLTRATDSSTTTPAFQLICKFEPSTDHSHFLIEPAKAQLSRSRAKVLATAGDGGGCSGLLALIWKWLLHSGEHVEMKFKIDLTAYWITQEKSADWKANQLKFDIPEKDLGEVKLPSTGGTTHIDIKEIGSLGDWFPGLPQSDLRVPEDTKRIPGLGTFTLRVLVTERDPSNAKQYLEKAGKEVERVADEATKKLSGAEDDADAPADDAGETN